MGSLGRKSILLLASATFLVFVVTPSFAQNPALIGPSFDEAGQVTLTELLLGVSFSVYVVAFGLTEISGYEFRMQPSVLPNFFLGKEVYGIAPLDFGTQFEVRAGIGGCVRDATVMGSSTISWTLCRYDLLYFTPANDVYFCVASAPSSGAPFPQFTLCDEDATKVPFYPASCGDGYYDPPACVVANPTMGQCEVLAEESS